MHAGKVDFGIPGLALDEQARRWKRANAATRTYLALMQRPGEWFDAWRLSQDAETTCVSTRISELRRQAPPWLRVERQVRGAQNYYRVVVLPGAESERAVG